MKTHYFIKEGKLFLIRDMPEYPEFSNVPDRYIDKSSTITQSSYNRLLQISYDEALQRAKDNAIEVLNQDEVMKLLWEKACNETAPILFESFLKVLETNSNYDLSLEGYRYEIKVKEDVLPNKVVALISPEHPVGSVLAEVLKTIPKGKYDQHYKGIPREEESQEEPTFKEKVLSLIDSYWKFSDNQIPMSSWHDKQDLLETIKKL